MTRAELSALIQRKKSFLCVGLDTDVNKLPTALRHHPDGVFEFNRAIIQSTLPFAVSYKLNLAFYEAMGVNGWSIFERTLALIPKDQAFVIADAKRSDIGNTAEQYARAFFETFACHAVTVNPYMGRDSVEPFTRFKQHWTIVLGLTSNEGASDVEMLRLASGRFVFEEVIEKIAGVGTTDTMMFVVGATNADYFHRVRAIIPHHFLLIPGVGAQGGALADIAPLMTSDCGVLVNSSRQIIYASPADDFAEAAARQAEAIQIEMQSML